MDQQLLITSDAAKSNSLKFDASFAPYLRFLRDKMERSHDIRAKFYRYILGKFERYPALTENISDLSILEDHQDLVQLVRMSLMPLAANSDDFLMALTFIDSHTIFYSTDRFKKLLIDVEGDFDANEERLSNLRFFIKLILERCYGIKDLTCSKMIRKVYNNEHHSIRHHSINIDSRFVDVHKPVELPQMKQEWIDMIKMDDENFLQHLKDFPADKFRLEGFCVLHVEDVSEEAALKQLQHAVLNIYSKPIEETLANMQVSVGELLGDSRIQIGVTPFFKVNGEVIHDYSFVKKSLSISATKNASETAINVRDIYRKFSENPHPYVFSKVDAELISQKPYLSDLFLNNIKSFMAYPIKSRDGLIGVFEVGCVEEGVVTHTIIEDLEQVFPIVKDVIYFMRKSFDDGINTLIKNKFTSLQPSVEWRFNEIAWQHIVHNPKGGDDVEVENIVFPQVYPLYGAVDIRNSSVERNVAFRKDYQSQLAATRSLLKETAKGISLPLLERLQFNCDELITSTVDILNADDELRVNDFFREEVGSFLKYVAARHPSYKKDIASYISKTEETAGEFFANRRAYEQSLQMINKGIINYFESEVQKLQEVYPFYFEKYRSDGVEYNIYMGQSIEPRHSFDLLYLKNLRLWQLSSMAYVARMNYDMLHLMPLALQTTQLILVHTHTIDISFRKDERRFDVEGSYNIRYEIIKKRIDKVRIKDTLERLTQPGYIAIVYSNIGEADEYIEHIKYLQSKFVLNDVFDLLELEDLQGVRGLKAIRVGVNFGADNA